MVSNNICIGLFGTCGDSVWRKLFMDAYEQLGIDFYNPQVKEWTPDRAILEAEHLVSDDIILMPITGETYGLGSLAETGFSIIQGMKGGRYIVSMIDSDISEELKLSNPTLARESLRSRALTLAHAKHISHQNVFFVDSLEKMLDVSISLHDITKKLKVIQGIRTTKI